MARLEDWRDAAPGEWLMRVRNGWWQVGAAAEAGLEVAGRVASVVKGLLSGGETESEPQPPAPLPAPDAAPAGQPG